MPRPTAENKVVRDNAIVAARARGRTVRTIAEQHALSERHVHEILAHRRQRRLTGPEFNAVGVVVEILDQLEETIERLSLLAEDADQDSVKLGALRSQVYATEQRFKLLQLCGLIPFEFRDLRFQFDAKLVGDIVVDFLRQHEIVDEDVRELLHRIDTHGQPKIDVGCETPGDTRAEVHSH